MCSICLAAESDAVFMPCGHCFACQHCSVKIFQDKGDCPICREVNVYNQAIEQVLVMVDYHQEFKKVKTAWKLAVEQREPLPPQGRSSTNEGRRQGSVTVEGELHENETHTNLSDHF